MRLLTLLIALMFSASVQAATLDWVDNSNGEDGFRVYRAPTTEGVFEFVGEVATGVTTFEDPNGVPGNCYRVTAFDADGESQPSNNACLPMPVREKKTPPGQLKAR